MNQLLLNNLNYRFEMSLSFVVCIFEILTRRQTIQSSKPPSCGVRRCGDHQPALDHHSDQHNDGWLCRAFSIYLSDVL